MPTNVFLNARTTRWLGSIALFVGAHSSSVYAQDTVQGAVQDTIRSDQSAVQTVAQASACPAALSLSREHAVVSGDTIESLAAAYSLETDTLLRFNPGVSNNLAPGSTLTIPPFNGSVVSVSPGETWQMLAERYNRRADLLFEVNGCVAEVPSRIFIPGAMSMGAPSGTISGKPSGAVAPSTVSRELSYPLMDEADVVLSYGWQPHSTRDELVFNSGIAFAIAQPNTVIATDSGTVAFAGQQSGYGNLVVINHADGLQTRYANLSDISVSVGQSVAAQDLVGQVGRESEASFLYFEVRKNSAEGWVAQDPGKYLPALDLR